MSVDIRFEPATKCQPLIDLSSQIIEILRATTSALVGVWEMPDLRVTVRLTDEYVAEIESQRTQELPAFTSKRVGGDAIARARCPRHEDEPFLVLVDASAFADCDEWLLAFVPQVLAHEIGHCLIGQARRFYGFPQRYSERPEDLLQVVEYTALSVCDEYLADRLGFRLMPTLLLTLKGDSEEMDGTDRSVLAVSRITRMEDDLDSVVYPSMRNRVLEYRCSGEGLTEMVDDLTRLVHECLIMSAHYRVAVSEMPPLNEMVAIDQHPGSKLYFEPFWNLVQPVLDSRFAGNPFEDFKIRDEAATDAAATATHALWATLGIWFEQLDDGVFVHVSDPDDVGPSS